MAHNSLVVCHCNNYHLFYAACRVTTMNILIVDDDNAVRLSIALALRRAGLESEALSNEDDALTAVRDERTALVILDMNLTLSTTGRQGLEMLQKIRILRPDIPVILITAWGTIPLTVEAMNLGAVDFLTKPWSNNDLVAKVKKAIARSEAARAADQHVDTLEDMERRAIIDALRRCDGNYTIAAQQLGITRQALYRRIEKFKL